jgi:hypothetical protein
VTIFCGIQELEWEQLGAIDLISPAFNPTSWLHVDQIRNFRKAYQENKRISLLEAMKPPPNKKSVKLLIQQIREMRYTAFSGFDFRLRYPCAFSKLQTAHRRGFGGLHRVYIEVEKVY